MSVLLDEADEAADLAVLGWVFHVGDPAGELVLRGHFDVGIDGRCGVGVEIRLLVVADKGQGAALVEGHVPFAVPLERHQHPVDADHAAENQEVGDGFAFDAVGSRDPISSLSF